MINDLQQLDTDLKSVSTQVCIIGGGTAGLFLAHRLVSRGIKVVVLETGGNDPMAPDTAGHEPKQTGIRYRGAYKGRSFGLGGTSVLWGGQMIPLTSGDVSARPAVGYDAWPISFEEISSHFQTVKTTLGLPVVDPDEENRIATKKYKSLKAFSGDYSLRLSEWLPFATRNMAKTFNFSIQSNVFFDVWLNATVTSFKLEGKNGTNSITTVCAKTKNGKQIDVTASVVVLCAGALESTRILLELDDATSGSITNSGAPLGKYFADHLSVTCGKFHCKNWKAYNSEFAPIFVGPIMRTPRLELTASAQGRFSVTSAFAHFTFLTDGSTGFDIVRNFLRRRQGETMGLGLSPSMAWRVVKDISAMTYYRYVNRRLWIPRDAKLLLQVDIEQMPNPNSRLSLDHSRDGHGRRQLVIDWRILKEDAQVIEKTARHLISAWSESPLSRMAELECTLPSDFSSFETLYDVYHPTGTIRMGASRSSSVVDENLQLWSYANAYVSSTAVFPSAGSANPGLTHLALTSRLADQIIAKHFA